LVLVFLAGQQLWYNISWLWDIVLSAVHQYAGVGGLYIFSLLCPAALMALLVGSLRARNPALGINALLFIGFAGIFTLFEFARGRPQLVGLCFALAFHHILHYSRENPQAKSLWLLPLIMVLWVNIHGSFIAGFSVLGAYGLEALYTKNRAWVLRLLLIGAACVPAVLINPYGIGIYTAVMRTLHSAITIYITEWQPFVFGSVTGASVWFLVFMFAGDMKNPAVKLADKILAAIWLVAMLYSARNIGFLLVLNAPYIAANLPKDDARDKNTRQLSAWLSDKKHALFMLCVAVLAVATSIAALPLVGEKHYRADPKLSPEPAIAYVTRELPHARLLNDYNIGGPIIYQTKGALPVFMDGRAGTVYSEEVIADYLAFLNVEKDWPRIVKKYRIDAILVLNTHSFAKAYDSGQYHDTWKQVFHDDAASVYVKK